MLLMVLLVSFISFTLSSLFLKCCLLSIKVFMLRTLVKVQRRSLAVECDVVSGGKRLTMCSAPMDRCAQGVSVLKEEQQCGMVASVERVVRHEAVIKGIDSDWQSNELDRFGNVTVLGSRPKGLWRKIAPAELMMIEDSSDVSFSSPDKSFTPRTMNAGKYAPVVGRVPKKSPVLQFNVYREGQSLSSVLNRLAYEIHVPEKRVNFTGQNGMSGPASFTEGFGCITNQGTALNVSAEALPRASRRYGVNALLFEPQSYVPLQQDGLRFGFFVDTQGTSYNLLLRCTSMSQGDANEMMTCLQRFGFVNYFPISYFSARGIKNHEVAAMVMKENYFEACSVFLQSHADSSTIFNKAFQKYINSSHEESHFFANTMKNTAAELRMCPSLVGFLDQLSTKSNEFKQMWDNCPESLRLQYLHASVAFVFNAMASQRCITGGTNKIVVGDLIYITASEFNVDAEKFSGFQPAMIEGIFAPSDEVVYVGHASQDDVDRFDIFRVVLPLCHVSESHTEGRAELQFPSSIATKELHTEFARAHSLGWLLEPSHENSILIKGSRSGLVGVALSQLHTYRTLLAKPSVDWSTRVETDPNSFSSLKTDLFLLQEKNTVSDLQKIQVGTTAKASRFRVPSPFNMSPKHREDLAPIIAEHSYKGNQRGDATSVGLSFKLPRGSHALSMLREKIDVTHARIDDLVNI